MFTECFSVYRVLECLQSASVFTECFSVYRVLAVFTVFSVLKSLQSAYVFTVFAECLLMLTGRLQDA